jgi:branched-chain amino acid transport system substrate-binding protein
VIGLATAGGDTINAIKHASEFGITASGQRIAALIAFITDINSLGLKTAQGVQFTEAFSWDMNDSRTWTKRFVEKIHGKQYPTSIHAGNYGGMLDFLKAIEAAQTRDGARIIAKMKELPTDDVTFGKGRIREDGRQLHPMYLFEVKNPEESKAPWDCYKLVKTISPTDAFRRLDQGAAA